jgi:subtilisin family serine protease
MFEIGLLATVFALTAGSAVAGAIDPQLLTRLESSSPDARLPVIVTPVRQTDLGSLPPLAGYDATVERLRQDAAEGQAGIIEFLRAAGTGSTRSFWLASRVAASATPDVIRALAARLDVALVAFDDTVRLDAGSPGTTARDGTDAPLWNITRVNAPAAWARGYTGAGVVVGNIDTGCEVTHPSFHGRWRSTDGWFDAVSGQPQPYDDHSLSHGTHTMGTICGGDGPGTDPNDIGIAPGCTFIAAKAFDASGSGTSSDIMAALDWMAGTGRPDVLSNSWGTSSSTDTTYLPHIRNLRSLGTVVVFSIGNDGPYSGSARAPGDLPHCISVGAVDSTDAVASFSSRGPAPNLRPWNDQLLWPRPDWNRVCPTMSAPGVDIVSAVRGDSFAPNLGTSMACPHVAGCAALLLQRDPTLTHDQIAWMLTESAEPLHGLQYPNNDYGWGMLDCNAALDEPPPAPAPWVVLDSTAVVGGNGNGVLEPGETADIPIWIINAGAAAATGLGATLSCDDPYITVIDNASAFGTVAGRSRASGAADPFRTSVSPSCPAGRSVSFHVAFHSNEGDWDADFPLVLGQVGSLLWGYKRLNGMMEQSSFLYTSAVAYHPFENRLYVTCVGALSLYVFASDSSATLLDSIPAPLGLAGSNDIAFSETDTTFWVHVHHPDQYSRLAKIRPDGTLLRDLPSPAGNHTGGLAFDPVEQKLYVSHWEYTGTTHVWVVDTSGVVLETLDFPAGISGNNQSSGLTIDRSSSNPLGRTLMALHMFYSTRMDSIGVWEYSLEDMSVVNRFMFANRTYLPYGICWDRRDGSFWVTFDYHYSPFFHQVAKFAGFHPVIAIDEPAGAPTPVAPQLSCSPVPSRHVVTFTGSSGWLCIYSAAGRLVRTLLSPGNSVTWDGRDESGHPVPPGIYLAKSPGSGPQAGTSKVVIAD